MALRFGFGHVHTICPSTDPSRWALLLGLLDQCVAYQPPIRDALQPLLWEAVGTDELEPSQQDAIGGLIRDTLIPLCERVRSLIYLVFYNDGKSEYSAHTMHSNMRHELCQRFHLTPNLATADDHLRYFKKWSCEPQDLQLWRRAWVISRAASTMTALKLPM